MPSQCNIIKNACRHAMKWRNSINNYLETVGTEQQARLPEEKAIAIVILAITGAILFAAIVLGAMLL